jgi:chemotaxis protein methyltransferase CheR
VTRSLAHTDGQASAAVAATYAFSDEDFTVIAGLAHRDFGLNLTLAKKELVYTRLSKRLRHLGLTDFKSYCRLVVAENSDAERLHMLSALTTNVTHFFREAHHFDTLRQTVLPPLIEAARKGQRVRIWSAGCSAGQEPYSLAFTVLALCPQACQLDIRILATDVDPVILERAREGTYDTEEVSALPDAVQAQFTAPAGKNRFAIAANARELITFAELNLMSVWPVSGPFDVIFCRNVAIYFDKPTQERLWSRFADLLPVGSHMFIGHSERVSGPAAGSFQAAGVTTYRKNVAPAARATVQ